MSTKNDFAIWLADNRDFLSRHRVSVNTARMIWDASAMSSSNKLIEMVYSGELSILPSPPK